jgi:putative membrane protein
MIRLVATMAPLALLLLSGPALAQADKPTPKPPGEPAPAVMPAPVSPAPADQLFVRQAAIGGMAEVALAKLVLPRSHNAAVEDFADRMLADHGKANDRLAELARKAGAALPETVDAEHAAMQQRLEGLSDTAFDLAYVDGQIVDHQKTAQLLEWQIGAGQDAELKGFAADVLPTVLDHLRMAQQLKAELAGRPGQGG